MSDDISSDEKRLFSLSPPVDMEPRVLDPKVRQ
jgi:hypothetical protein